MSKRQQVRDAIVAACPELMKRKSTAVPPYVSIETIGDIRLSHIMRTFVANRGADVINDPKGMAPVIINIWSVWPLVSDNLDDCDDKTIEVLHSILVKK